MLVYFNSWVLKSEQDDSRHTSPLSQSSSPYCTALQFAVDILQYQNWKLGTEKRFIASQLLFHMKIEQLHLYLYLAVQNSLFLLPCIMFSLYSN